MDFRFIRKVVLVASHHVDSRLQLEEITEIEAEMKGTDLFLRVHRPGCQYENVYYLGW